MDSILLSANRKVIEGLNAMSQNMLGIVNGYLDSAYVERLHGISNAYICDVLKRRREPGAKILDALYLVKEVRYVPKIQKREKS